MVQEAEANPMETETAEDPQAGEQVKESLQEQEKPLEEGSIATTQGAAEGWWDKQPSEMKALMANNKA